MKVIRLLALLCVVTVRHASAQLSGAPALQHAAFTLDSISRTSGPAWDTVRSRHFIVHLERPSSAASAAQMLDSLEAAWDGAVSLLRESPAGETHAHVFVTRSRTRFPALLSPESKGLMTRLVGRGEVIILVQNDSVRAYTRHEVMHLVTWRVWGAAVTGNAWLIEGLATFADGRCQGSTIRAVGRDLLSARSSIRAGDLLTNFLSMYRSDRAATYVLAGTFVDYLWASRGRNGVKRLWRGDDSLIDIGVLPGLGGDLTAGWRAHVARSAGQSAGLDPVAFRRFGCG
ncbi:MAG TPA: hypothetical protein VGP25_13625 [Gemmatimonadaceae bacterium]|jgi:hypothetical protein|nr:hypothetical protein [Gemmatimonadaceae bacterium]